jgi:hypothetical protein
VRRIMTETVPSLLELMDRTSLRAVEAFQPMGLDTSAAALLLAQTYLSHGVRQGICPGVGWRPSVTGVARTG